MSHQCPIQGIQKGIITIYGKDNDISKDESYLNTGELTKIVKKMFSALNTKTISESVKLAK